jgi:hypothetical protein
MRGALIHAGVTAAVAALIAGGLSCGGGRGPAPGPPAAADAGTSTLDPAEAEILAGGFRDTLEAMVAAVRARTGAACGGDAGVPPDGGRCADCASLAVDLDAVFDRSEPLFKRAREVAMDADSARVLDDAMKSQGRGVPALIDEIAAGLTPCAGHADLIRTMERMPVL